MAFCGHRDGKSFTRVYMAPLLEAGLLAMTVPGNPRDRNQRYVAT